MTRFEITIKGKKWTVRILTDSRYEKICGDDSEALTKADNREILFRKKRLLPGTVRHELLHAFISESHIESSNLDSHQIEELCCSLVDYCWSDINQLVDEIFIKFHQEG